MSGSIVTPTEMAERRRRETAASLDSVRQQKLGQFFTPASAADFLASMLTKDGSHRIRLLDPGAGVGSLTAAAVERLADLDVQEVEVVAWEIDEQLHTPLRATLRDCAAWSSAQGLSMSWELRGSDYIKATADALPSNRPERFDAVIMNPPYRKIGGRAPERRALESIGVPITNLYTAFLALATTQLKRGGILVAITPRSFASGLYSAPFRHFFFDRVGIERLHLFESRAHVFADANVLQENLIFSARRAERPHKVWLSLSRGVEDAPSGREVPAEEIVRPDDPQRFLRIPGSEKDTEVAEIMATLPSSLTDMGIAVSTGKVVEFRMREHLRETPGSGAAPLIRPNHFKGGEICWPDTTRHDKPNALTIDPTSLKVLLPNATYVLVKRLTAKEERKRVCAAVCDPSVAPGQQIAFENHLNVFHRDGQGLPNNLAHGLAAYLNSSFVDRYVRQFNGHTQINATDLRHLRYPSKERLCDLGSAVLADRSVAQDVEEDLVDMTVHDESAKPLSEAA